jgi:hypothetical protein
LTINTRAAFDEVTLFPPEVDGHDPIFNGVAGKSEKEYGGDAENRIE